MARPELSDEQWNKLSEELKKQKTELREKHQNLKHHLENYNEGSFNNHEVIIVTLRSLNGKQKFIVPKNSQMSMRTQYYWINGINGYLEDGLVQDRLVIVEDYEELFLNEEKHFVNRKLL